MSCRYCLHYSEHYDALKEKFDGYCTKHSMKVRSGGSCNEYVNKESYNYNREKSIKEKIDYKDSLCFLTSACVEYLGKEDNCRELTVLRQFRDGYMRTIQNGQEMIDEYYRIAPDIVIKINECEDRNSHYEYIYKVICECIDYISDDQHEKALNEYVSMVLKLKNTFGIQ